VRYVSSSSSIISDDSASRLGEQHHRNSLSIKKQARSDQAVGRRKVPAPF